MARLYGVCLGLLLFSAIIVSGISAGNSAERIVLRAVVGLFGGIVIGTTAGWIGLSIVRDNIPAHGADSAKPPKPGEPGKTAQAASAKS
jgi:hypothetical protein